MNLYEELQQQQQQQQLVQLQIQEQQYRIQKLSLQIAKIPLEQHDPLILLGALLNLTGLTFYDVNQLLLGAWYPKQKPQNVKNYILNDADVIETFLKKASDLQINFDILVKIYNKFYDKTETVTSFMNNIDNPTFTLNGHSFSLKKNKEIRDKLLKELFKTYDINKNQLALLFNVVPSTVSKAIGKEYHKENK